MTFSRSNGNYWFIVNCVCFLQDKILFKKKETQKLPVLCKQVVQWGRLGLLEFQSHHMLI